MKTKEARNYIELECERQWNDCQAELFGTWDKQPDAIKNKYRKDMERHLQDSTDQCQ